MTVRVWLLLAPRTTLLLTEMGAVAANVVAAFTVKVSLPVVPRTVLP